MVQFADDDIEVRDTDDGKRAPLGIRSAARRRFDREIDALFVKNYRRRHTLIGFAAGVCILALLLFLLRYWNIAPHIRQPERQSVPIVLLQFGAGDPALPSAGNLTAEGAATKARQSAEPLEDARKATPQPKELAAPVAPETAPTAFFKPVKEEKTRTDAARASESATAKSDVGAKTPDAQAENEGLGRFGFGAGRGQGYNLDWGGGGNRVALHKELPKYPPGVTTSTQIKMRFTVLPNGSVGMIIPMQKGEPALERAAMEALRRWQFNPASDGKDMIGFITFTFRVQ